MNNLKFDLDDIVIVPSEESAISSRKECDPYYSENGVGIHFPLIASPMDTVVNEQNYKTFISNGIIPCIPRGNNKHLINKNTYFQAVGLKEIEEDLVIKYNEFGTEPTKYLDHYPKILIDIANGHMKKLINIVKEIKKRWPETTLMVGNVANPETFVNLAKAGADYIRCSVGTGAGCTTAANVAINYPLGSLISECKSKKIQHGLWNTKIVADGGMRNYSDIIKALALGADYVMVGSIFNKAIESSGFNYLWKIRINNKIAELLWKYDFPIKKKYRGMSTKSVQRSWGKTNLITAEGITKYQSVEYTLSQWTENFKDYLKSAMSYCNTKTLNDFIGTPDYIFITENAKKRFNK